jgi:general secretion pathway protein N
MKRRYLVLLGLLAFLGTLLLHMPASFAYAWLSGARKDTPSSVTVHGVHGTVSDGGFDALTLRQRPVLQNVAWTLHPAWLALLRVSADFSTGGDTVARVRVSRSVFGKVRLSGLTLAGSVKSLLGLLGQPAWPVEGQARLEMPLVKLAGGIPVEAEGTAQIESLVWAQAREPLPLGSFTATMATDDKGIAVTLDSGPGALELSGTASLTPEQAYDVHLQLRPRPQATEQLRTLIRSLGAPDAQGWFHIRRSGSLAPAPTPPPQ